MQLLMYKTYKDRGGRTGGYTLYQISTLWLIWAVNELSFILDYSWAAILGWKEVLFMLISDSAWRSTFSDKGKTTTGRNRKETHPLKKKRSQEMKLIADC